MLGLRADIDYPSKHGVFHSDFHSFSEGRSEEEGARWLKRDEIGLNHHRALGCCLSMTFSENRFALFRIML
jgi:hypothetical protein